LLMMKYSTFAPAVYGRSTKTWLLVLRTWTVNLNCPSPPCHVARSRPRLRIRDTIVTAICIRTSHSYAATTKEGSMYRVFCELAFHVSVVGLRLRRWRLVLHYCAGRRVDGGTAEVRLLASSWLRSLVGRLAPRVGRLPQWSHFWPWRMPGAEEQGKKKTSRLMGRFGRTKRV
jgi:hypothetical protein